MGLNYRREIDGLRAVAVTSVILFHAGIPGFSGGFVGVDVFFVISGYLITLLLLMDIADGRVSIAGFYERRARRILPALFFVMLATIPFAWMWMIPEELKAYGQSMVAVTVFVSNVLFWLKTDYFASGAEEQPFLHTWSLSVEEQFYVLFPLLLVLLSKAAPRIRLGIIGAIAIFSLVVSDLAATHYPMAAFFLLTSRAWELLAGALCALLPPVRLARLAEPFSALGLAMIVGSVFLLSQTTPFPGRYALFPVVGAALVLSFASERTLAGRLLSLRPLVGIGLLSYSAYLWHQPLFAFARIRLSGHISLAFFALLILLTFILAFLTWRFVEQPFRGHGSKLKPRRQLFGSAVVLSLILGCLGFGFWFSGGLPNRLSSKALVALSARQDVGKYRACLDGQVHGFKHDDCGLGDPSRKEIDFMLVGDSLAAAIADGVDVAARKAGQRGIFLAIHACPPLLGIGGAYAPSDSTCEEVQRGMVDAAKEARVKVVVLAGAWRFLDDICSLSLDPCAGADRSGLQVLAETLKNTISSFREIGAAVVVIGSPPRGFEDIPQAMAHSFMWGNGSDIRLARKTATATAFNTAMGSLGSGAPKFINVESAFCDDSLCEMSNGGIPRFFDQTHVTASQSRDLAPILSGIFEPDRL